MLHRNCTVLLGSPEIFRVRRDRHSFPPPLGREGETGIDCVGLRTEIDNYSPPPPRKRHKRQSEGEKGARARCLGRGRSSGEELFLRLHDGLE